MGSSSQGPPMRLPAAETGAAISAEGCPRWGTLAHSLMWLLAGSSSSHAAGPRAPWPLTWTSPHSSHTGPLASRSTSDPRVHLQDTSHSLLRLISVLPTPAGKGAQHRVNAKMCARRGHPRACLRQRCVSYTCVRKFLP